jgi:hypothetical protein
MKAEPFPQRALGQLRTRGVPHSGLPAITYWWARRKLSTQHFQALIGWECWPGKGWQYQGLRRGSKITRNWNAISRWVGLQDYVDTARGGAEVLTWGGWRGEWGGR